MRLESGLRMAHQRIGKLNHQIKVDLSAKGIAGLKEAIAETQEELVAKCDEFCRRMAEEGVTQAKLQITTMDAVDTGNLYNSIDMKPGTVIRNGASWLVFTNCEYAEYVEFGTGTEGAKSPHPSGMGKYNQDMSNKVKNPYNKNDPRLGWFYGPTWTAGMGSRPFMWNSWEYLKLDSTIRKIAKEVFG